MPTEKQIAKVAKLREKCRKYGLSAPPEFWNATSEELASIYNGAGPDWLPQWGRVILTFFLWLFAAAFLIHDFRFDRSDRSEVGFTTANSEMLENMWRINDLVFPRATWYWRLLHDRWSTKAWLAYEACRLGGWSAWCDGKSVAEEASAK